MKHLSKKTISGLLSIAVLGGGMFAAGQAAAMCCYNHTASTRVNCDLGGTTLHVDPGDHKCTDGTGGECEIRKVIPDAPDQSLCTVMVDDHGWVSVYDYEGVRYKITSKHADKTLRDTCYSPY